MLDVLTIGDLMIDFTSLGTNEAGKLVFDGIQGVLRPMWLPRWQDWAEAAVLSVPWDRTSMAFI